VFLSGFGISIGPVNVIPSSDPDKKTVLVCGMGSDMLNCTDFTLRTVPRSMSNWKGTKLSPVNH
jgi:hypothetical protein